MLPVGNNAHALEAFHLLFNILLGISGAGGAEVGNAHFLVVELNMGQMVDDVRLAVNGKCPVGFYGRQGGNIFTPEEIAEEFKKFNNLK